MWSLHKYLVKLKVPFILPNCPTDSQNVRLRQIRRTNHRIALSLPLTELYRTRTSEVYSAKSARRTKLTKYHTCHNFARLTTTIILIYKQP